MADFTKGKWSYFRNSENNYSIAVTNSEGQRIVIAESFSENDDDIIPDAKANACLIANAPEMHSLLVQILNDENCELDPDVEGDIMQVLKDINGGWW